MANIKQQKKRVLTNEKRHAAASSFKASVKTAMKAVYVAVDKKDLEAAVLALNLAIPAASSNIILLSSGLCDKISSIFP